MINCGDAKYKCGKIWPSACIAWTGKDLTSITIEANVLTCDANVNDVVFGLDAEIKKLQDYTSLKDIDLDCLELAEDAVLNSFSLHQAEILQICENKANIAALTTQFNTWDISAEIITIDLPACLEADAAPCAVGVNEYSLISLLTLFAAKLCDHESRLDALEA